MKILLIAPANPTLPGLDAEIAAIDSFHDVTALVGIVREVDIADEIAQNPEGWDCVWWASHGSDLGVQITNEVLTADGVGQYLVASRARLCVLNTCASEALARQIIVGTDCDLIYTVSDVLDSDSLRFGSLLAGELAKTENYHTAFTLASPKRGRYKYLAAKAAIRSLDVTVSGELQKLGARVDEGVKSYQSIQKSFYQMEVDAKTDRSAVNEIKQQLATMEQKFEIMRQQTQTQIMREDLRKEGQNRDIAAMGQRIDSQAPVSAPAPIPLPSGQRTPPATWVLIILLTIIILAGVFFAGKYF